MSQGLILFSLSDNIDLFIHFFSPFYQHQFPASTVFQGRNVREDVTVIKAKITDEHWDVWLLVALNNDKPRLIIPCVHLDFKSSTHSDNEVSLVIESIEHKPTIVSAKFLDSIDAAAFYAFAKSTACLFDSDSE